jgi:hypothetical protein
MQTLWELPFSSTVVHIEPLLQVAFELTLPPSFVHSPSVSGAFPLVLGGIGAGFFLTTAKAGEAARAIAKAIKYVSDFMTFPGFNGQLLRA